MGLVRTRPSASAVREDDEPGDKLALPTNATLERRVPRATPAPSRRNPRLLSSVRPGRRKPRREGGPTRAGARGGTRPVLCSHAGTLGLVLSMTSVLATTGCLAASDRPSLTKQRRCLWLAAVLIGGGHVPAAPAARAEAGVRADEAAEAVQLWLEDPAATARDRVRPHGAGP